MMKDAILSALGFPKSTQLVRLNSAWPRLCEQVTVLDRSTVSNSDELKATAFELQTMLHSLKSCQSIVVMGRSSTACDSAGHRIYQRALVGMIRSMAKEIGHKGQRINIIRTRDRSEVNENSIVSQFFGTQRSAFITGQEIELTRSGISGNLENKICLVTGGSRGIGASCVARLQKEKAHVIIIDVPSSKNAASDLLEAGAEFYGCDVTDMASVSRTIATILGHYMKIDVLVNNAGITRDKTLKKMTEQHWDQVIAVNLQAVLNLTDNLLAADGMTENGRIINMSSISGIAGNFGQTNYTASKAALIEMGAAYASHLEDQNITVNAIAPGFIKTDMVKTMPMMTQVFAERLTCLAQAGTPEDIAEAVTFLAHPGAQGVNGQVLRVCGGSFLGA